jgi:hypothetical protein
MMWDLSDKEMAAVMRRDATERYKHLIKRVADHELVWGLWSEGWALMGDDSGREVVPIWPHAPYAAACAKDDWSGYEPRQIDLSEWMERWLPGMKRDRRLVAVFPIRQGKTATVEPDDLLRDLEEELQRY